MRAKLRRKRRRRRTTKSASCCTRLPVRTMAQSIRTGTKYTCDTALHPRLCIESPYVSCVGARGTQVPLLHTAPAPRPVICPPNTLSSPWLSPLSPLEGTPHKSMNHNRLMSHRWFQVYSLLWLHLQGLSCPALPLVHCSSWPARQMWAVPLPAVRLWPLSLQLLT